jgi:soluble lytic murein transglycosylase-like protein
MKFQAFGSPACSGFSYKPLHIAGLYTLLLWLAIAPGVSSFYPLPRFDTSAAEVFLPSSDYMTLKEYFSAQSLDAEDALIYQQLFRLQRDRQWAELDKAAQHLKNKELLAWLQGEKLASPAYRPTLLELTEWLAHNEFLPQAARIQQRLAALDPALSKQFAPLAKSPVKPAARRPQPPSLYVNMTLSQRSVMEGVLRQFSARQYKAAHEASSRLAAQAKKTLPGALWIAGLTAHQLGRSEESHAAFHRIAEWAAEEKRPEWKAQAHYWAFRTAAQLGQTEHAEEHLASAAHDKTSFYGLLAQTTANEHHALAAGQENLSTRALRAPVLRLISMSALLRDAGQVNEAEKLIRGVFTRVEPTEQKALLWTASALQFDKLQLPLASQMATLDLRSHYPMPGWHEELKVDPALVLAIVRRESGFDPNAGSQAGAQGLMQIIPSTFHYMVNKQSALDVQVADGQESAYLAVAPVKGGLKDPHVNLRVGQSYLRYLQDQPYIGTNLIYLIAAYNAGPGSLQAWAEQAKEAVDPLLFIESIPYRETREYVKNVMTDYWIYSQLLERDAASLESLAHGQWPESQI